MVKCRFGIIVIDMDMTQYASVYLNCYTTHNAQKPVYHYCVFTHSESFEMLSSNCFY